MNNGSPHCFFSQDVALMRPNEELDLTELPGSMRKHLRALRIKNGELFVLINGNGLKTVLKKVSDTTAVCESSVQIDQKKHEFILRLAPPKSADLEEAVVAAAEIGFSSVEWIRSEHVQWKKGKELPLARLERLVVSSMEQCGRPWKMRLTERWLSLHEALSAGGTHVWADESLASAGEWGFAKQVPKLTNGIYVYIGPEGGWSLSERRMFDGRAASMCLGSNVLRVSTAVVAAGTFLHLID